MSQFLMPSLGADMEAGTLTEQLIQVGQPVKRGDVIAAVETQKGVIEIEVFEDGILDDWLVEIGTEVPVGTPLATIRSNAADIAEHASPMPAAPDDVQRKNLQGAPPPHIVPAPSTPPMQPETVQRPREIRPRLKITPAARRLMAQKEIAEEDLNIQDDSVIGRADIEVLAAPTNPDPALDMRTAIAAAMSRSKREIPHYYLSQRVDLTASDSFVKQVNEDRDPDKRLLLTALYVKAIALALQKYPEFNGHYKQDQFFPSQAIHIGLATHIRSGGLVAPALFDADAANLDSLMVAMRDVVLRVRAGRFRARELSGATITLTSLGERGVDQLYGVIYPPQVAIIGIGTPRNQPIVHAGQVTPRLSAMFTLAADHRASDGHRGALLLRKIGTLLQEPASL